MKKKAQIQALDLLVDEAVAAICVSGTSKEIKWNFYETWKWKRVLECDIKSESMWIVGGRGAS